MTNKELYSYKPYLFSIAYNLTGDISLSEDLVQDTFEKWLKEERAEVLNRKAYLSRMLVNRAIDLMKIRQRERNLNYKGVWLPEPLLNEGEKEEDNVTLDYSIMFLLEKLNPYERAVFVFLGRWSGKQCGLWAKDPFASPHLLM